MENNNNNNNNKVCLMCNKNIELTFIECKCKNFYCKKHIYSDVHNCSFNYFHKNQIDIKNTNPIIKTKKI